jgi:hypothetical protein
MLSINGVMLLHNKAKSSVIRGVDALTKHSSLVRYLIATVRASVVKRNRADTPLKSRF